VLRDRAHRHELPGRPGRHLRPVIADGQEDRGNSIIERSTGVARHAGVDEVKQALELERFGERLDLGAGLLGRDDLADPLALTRS